MGRPAEVFALSLCSIESCSKIVKARGLCSRHYRFQVKYGDPLAGKPRRNTAEIVFRDDAGRKQCACCGEWLAEEHFYSTPTGGGADGLRDRCTRCFSDYKRGLTFERRRELLEIQGGTCLCGKEFKLYGLRSETYFIDHDHSCCLDRSCCDCIRGLLCNSCNLVLGHAGDDPAVLEKLIGYLAGAAPA